MWFAKGKIHSKIHVVTRLYKEKKPHWTCSLLFWAGFATWHIFGILVDNGAKHKFRDVIFPAEPQWSLITAETEASAGFGVSFRLKQSRFQRRRFTLATGRTLSIKEKQRKDRNTKTLHSCFVTGNTVTLLLVWEVDINNTYVSVGLFHGGFFVNLHQWIKLTKKKNVLYLFPWVYSHFHTFNTLSVLIMEWPKRSSQNAQSGQTQRKPQIMKALPNYNVMFSVLHYDRAGLWVCSNISLCLGVGLGGLVGVGGRWTA